MTQIRKNYRQWAISEKANNERMWDEVMKDSEKGKIDRFRIVGIIDRINSFDYEMIERGYKDLL